MNGSILSGSHPYTYTSIRFQLSRDSSNNIYVKIYKINKGSLNMPRMFYEIQSSDDPTIPGTGRSGKHWTTAFSRKEPTTL